MKKGFFAAALCALACTTAVVGGSASAERNDPAARKGPIKVACANSRLKQVHFDRAPRTCIFLERGGTMQFQAADGYKLKWKRWGRPHAQARGIGYVNMLGKTPIRAKLSKPVRKCGHRVYSKVRVRYPKLGTGGVLKLETCTR